MDAADSNATISRSDRDLVRRLTAVIVFAVLFTAAFSYLWRLYATKFHAITGAASWIWLPHRINLNVPLVFFAARDFDLPPHRAWTRIKILGDPEYTLYFNGQLVGGRRVGDDRHLDVFDVSELARDTGNRIVVAVRSTNGVGGLIASVDLKPEVENFIVTGPEWKLFRQWDETLPVRDTPGKAVAPVVIGKPPVGRWNFLSTRPGDPLVPAERVVKPLSAESYRTEIPTIRVTGGVAVGGKEAIRATAFDFGPNTRGRIRITSTRGMPLPWVVHARTANAAEELRAVEAPSLPFVFAPGEESVTDPGERVFQYVIVYGRGAYAEVLQ